MNKHPPPNVHSLFKRVLKRHPRKPGQEIRAWSKEVRLLWYFQLRKHNLYHQKGNR